MSFVVCPHLHELGRDFAGEGDQWQATAGVGGAAGEEEAAQFRVAVGRPKKRLHAGGSAARGSADRFDLEPTTDPR